MKFTDRKDYKLPEVLKAILKEHGMLQRDLAKKIGSSDSAVSHWITGSSIPKLYEAMAIAEFFGVTVDYLVYGED